FTNSGAVQALSGNLALQGGGGATSSGTFSVAAGATLQFGRTQTLTATSSVSGAGAVNFFGNVTVNGTYNVTGSTAAIGGGTISFNGPVQAVGSVLSAHDGGVLAFNTTPAPALSVTSLTIYNNGAVYFNTAATAVTAGTLSLSSGTLGGPGAVTVTGLTT